MPRKPIEQPRRWGPADDARQVVTELRLELAYPVHLQAVIASLPPETRGLLRQVVKLAYRSRRAAEDQAG